MEQRENEAAIGCYERVYKTVLTQEVSGEAVVPDPMPDVEQLLDTQAEIYIRSRTLGGGRVSLEGSVHCTVLYLGAERTLPQKTELDLPLNIMAEDPLLADADEFTAEVALSSAETRPVNARKLMVRAEIAAAITGYKKTQMDFSTQTEDPGALELLKQQATLGYIACVSEKDFVVSEEVRLADNALAERLLLTDVTLSAGETKRVASKMILQGSAELFLLYAAPEDTLHRERFVIPFSQIMDVPEENVNAVSVTLYPSACYVELLPGLNGSGEVSVELHLHATAVCAAERQADYIADAYCLRHPCQIDMEDAAVFEPFRVLDLRENLRESISLPDTGAEVVYCAASACLPVAFEGGVRVPVNVRAVYAAEGGRLGALTRRLSAEFKLPEPLRSAGLFTAPVCSDISATISAGDLELRLAVELQTMEAGEKKLSFVRSAQVEDQETVNSLDCPSAVIVRPGDRSAWTLAKQYGSTVELIESANPEGVHSGGLLLIPRAR